MNTPDAVKNLKLRWAFKGVTSSLEQYYTVVCDTEFFIEDDTTCSKRTIVVQTPSQNKYCKILNTKGTEAVILAIDNALIPHHKGGIADGAVFNTNDFHFVEFKTNAKGTSVKAVDEIYRKAMQQLKSTVDLFNGQLQKAKIEFTQAVNVECHMIVALSFPRNSATEMTYALKFAKETEGISLSFDNIIELT